MLRIAGTLASSAQTLPDRLIEQVTPLSAMSRWNCSLVYWADSTGRRGMFFPGLAQALVKGFGGRFPPERFSRAAVERGCHGGKVVGGVRAGIGAFGQNTVVASRWYFRWCRAAPGFADRRSRP
jgi:hypothetical protein